MKSIAHLGDAAIMAVLLIAVISGADLRWVVGTVLLLAILSELSKAFSSYMEPIAKVVRELNRRPG